MVSVFAFGSKRCI